MFTIHRRCILASLAVALLASPALANFHLMQIQQVIGGVNGDTDAQAVQLRLRATGENLVSGGKLVIHDAAGAATTTIDLTTDVSNGASGSTVLIASPKFISTLPFPGSADFSMTNGSIPTAAGSVTWERDNGTVLWRISWGGAGYTGATNGDTTNDLDGQFGVFPNALPSSSSQALKFNGAANAMSTTNQADFSITAGAAAWTNNAGVSFPPDCNNNGILDTDDIAHGTSQDCNSNDIPDECETDTDNDGTIDGCDTCTDTDGDGAGNPGFPANTCPQDGCPNDPNKTAPGACGCGHVETDSDGDGTPDCHDGCPSDPNKTAPGNCGCGVVEHAGCTPCPPGPDSDGDGTPDCIDGCPNDPHKTAPGDCGCGNSDDDSDGDGVVNCNDGCPDDPNKVEPGRCGCGIEDVPPDQECPAAPPPTTGCGAACGTGASGSLVSALLPLVWLRKRARRRRDRH